nr:type II secretion system protein GspE [Actinomycetota bacterium]
AGCPVCSNTGYRGRIAIHEVMNISDEMERLIASAGKSHEIRQLALEEGMMPMRLAGFRQVASGVTSVDEILRVIA